MVNKHLRSLSELLAQQDSTLTRLVDQVREHRQLVVMLQEILPPELAAGMLDCSVGEDGVLIITAADASAATRLRFESPRLITQCQIRHPGVERARVRVATVGGVS